MKSTVANWTRPLYCMRIVCSNGTTIRICEFPEDVTISGQTYRADTGYTFTGVESGTTFSPGSLDLKSFVGVAPEITVQSIQAGIFDSAKIYYFVTDWASKVEDEEPIMRATFGKVRIEDDAYRVETIQLIDLYNVTVGDSYSASCPLVFGGQEFAGCKVDAEALQATGAITSVTSVYEFADTSLNGNVDDYFGAGRIWFTTGANTGIAAQRVKDFTQTGGLISLNEPFPYLPEVGDEFVIEPGCRKRLVDCRDKYSNNLRRRGFDWIPGTRFLNKIGGTK